MMPKVARLAAMAHERHLHIDIEVDGGINLETAASAVQAGANILVIGTAIFDHPQGMKFAMEEIRTAMESIITE